MATLTEPSVGLDEVVHLSDWRPDWAANARAIASELASHFQRTSRIEHIGSTSIEGMVAKPILDLIIGVGDTGQQETTADTLCSLGYEDMGEAGIPGRRHLRKRLHEQVNVHVVLLGSPLWIGNISVRDFLRVHPDECAVYAALKKESIESGAHRLLAYSDRKAAFMVALLNRATAWRKTETRGG